MYYFNCDYTEGALPEVLDALVASNRTPQFGYGEDEYTASAAEKIKAACNAPDADILLVVGGTQANSLILKSILRPHQGVIAADTGHIAVHESGAVEATGHKVMTLPGTDGKISSAEIRAAFESHYADPTHEHMVQPGAVYISQPTELGTLYTREEIEAIHAVCKAYNVPLFVDGARLAYALAVPLSRPLTLEHLAANCDVFYIGGTKCGTICGEAIVIINDALKKDFRSIAKQHGALLAKGRLLGVQFDALFTDDLYVNACKKAVSHALHIKKAFEVFNAPVSASRTNQQFPALTDAQIEFLSKRFVFEQWHRYDETRTVCRFCTSWSTSDEAVAALLADIQIMPQPE